LTVCSQRVGVRVAPKRFHSRSRQHSQKAGVLPARYARRVLIVIEGVDGAGKRTLTMGLRAAFEAAHKSVATLAFPRYGHSVEADLAAEALHGAHGDLSESVYAMAVLFALDRAGAREEIGHLNAAYDVVILDRYVASNAAYSAARLHQGPDGDVVEWVRDLEYERIKLPKPDWQVLLDVPAELAAQRAEHRAATEADRAKDSYERDDGLQRRTKEVYAGLADADWCGRWRKIGPDIDPSELAEGLA
jgi:dTMP kinase